MYIDELDKVAHDIAMLEAKLKAEEDAERLTILAEEKELNEARLRVENEEHAELHAILEAKRHAMLIQLDKAADDITMLEAKHKAEEEAERVEILVTED